MEYSVKLLFPGDSKGRRKRKKEMKSHQKATKKKMPVFSVF